MDWPTIRLGDIAQEFISGGTPSTKVEHYWTGNTPWVTGADINGNVIFAGRKWITQAAIENSATHVVPKGAILFVTRTGVGKVAKAGTDIAISQDLTGIVLKKGTNAGFVIAAIQQEINNLLNIQQGAIIKGVLRKDIENLSIPFPPLSEQRRIVDILDRADRLCRLRAEADAKASRILPALFIKMFGNPDKAWNVARLGDLLRRTKGALQSGPFGTHLHNSDFVPSGTILTVGIDNVLDGEFILGRNRRITAEKYEELTKYTLERGDVLITIMGTVGRTCVFPGTPSPAICTKHVYRIQLDNTIHPEYLSATLRFSQATRAQIGAGVTGQVVPGIKSENLRRLQLDVPPAALQAEFAARKQEIDAIRHRDRNVRKAFEKLFSILAHRAFTAELTAFWREAHMAELLQEMAHQPRVLAQTVSTP